MDTNTMQTNTFNKGMNTDASDMIIGSDEYRLANNLRYTTTDQENSGELHIIEGAASALQLKGEYTILATTSIRNYGIIIYEKEDNNVTSWYVDRFENPYDDDLTEFKPINQTTIFGPCNELLGYEKDKDERNKISLVTKWESDDIVKLYIADGVHPIMSLNIRHNYCKQDNEPNSINEILSSASLMLNKPIFVGLTSGKLKSGLVQYSYRLYKNHNNATEISPTTRLIQIGDITSTDNVIGCEQDKVTTAGVVIEIPVEETYKSFDKIEIFRIQYVANGTVPTIDIIYDGDFQNNFQYKDTGMSSIGQLTVEEYNSYSGIHIIPKVIESKNDYLFAANIKYDSTAEDLFQDWDARSFSFTPTSDVRSHLFNFNQQSEPITISPEYLQSGDLSVLDDCDCYNAYNDMTKTMFEYDGYNFNHLDIINLDEDVHKGYYDRYDKDGYYGGSGVNIDWRFVVTELYGDQSPAARTYIVPPGQTQSDGEKIHMTGSSSNTIHRTDDYPVLRIPLGYIKKNGTIEDADYANVDDYVKSLSTSIDKTYSNPKISYCFKSLRRDELYRYGIILYDKFGNSSNVKWIADIRTPNMAWKGCEAFISHSIRISGNASEDTYVRNGIDLSVRPLGIRFTVRNLPEGCSGYEIVRCNRTVSDIATLTQGVVARPITQQYTWNFNAKRNLPYVPSGFLTTNRIWEGEKFGYRDPNYNEDEWWNGHEADNFSNDSLYQFVSPEVVYQKDSTTEILKTRKLTLNPIKYVFGGCGCDNYYEFSDKEYWIPRWKVFEEDGTWHHSYSEYEIEYGHEWDPEKRLSYAIHSGVANTSIVIGNRSIKNGNTVAPNDKLFNYISAENIHNFSSTRVNGPYYSNVEHTPVKFSYLPYKQDCSDYLNDKKVQRGEGSKCRECDNIFDAIRHTTAYIKLYEQSNSVISRIRHKDDAGNNLLTKTISGFKDLPSLHTNVLSNYNIKNITMAPELGWDDCVETKDGISYFKYRNYIANIGDKQYCNWVSGGAYDMDDVANFIKEDDYQVLGGDDNGSDQLNGPSGRCLLLDIESSNPLSVKNINTKSKRLYDKCVSNYNNSTVDNLSDTIASVYAITEPSEYELLNEYSSYTKHDKISTLRYTKAERRPGRVVAQIPTSQDFPDYIQYDNYYTSAAFGDLYEGETSLYYEGSALGTFLCNIRQTVTPYGGSDNQAKKLSSYYSYGDYFKNDPQNVSTHDVFDGDCFIAPMEYSSMHKCYDPVLKNTITLSVVYAIPVETNINLNLEHGYTFSDNCEIDGITNIQIEASNVNNKFNQNAPMYQYNTAYSSQPTAKVFTPSLVDEQDKDDDVNDYRVFYSNPKSNKETIDNWLKFQPLNYLDVDTRYGQITGLRTFHNSLVFWQEEAAGVLSVNERTTITDDSNMPLILGTGGVLSRYDYFNSLNGMHKNEFADAQSDSTLYWWDHNKHELCAYAGGNEVAVISKLKNVQNFLNKMSKEGKLLVAPILAFDKQHNELICNVSDGDETSHESGALVYSERTSQFTSLYDIHHTNAVQFSNVLYLFKAYDKRGELPGRLIGYEWNRGHEDIPKKLRYKKVGMEYVVMQRNLMPYLKYVVNQNSSNVKVFDNVSFGASRGTDSLLKFTFNTPLGQNSSTSDITNREYDYRLAVPRNNGEEYGGRMRGKTMQCEVYKYDDSLNNNFALQYINTKYRISWS